jgi:hypothetical protein
MRKFAIAVVAASALSLTAVPALAQWHSVKRGHEPTVTGSGRIVSQQRAIGNFHRVEIKGATNAQIRLGVAPSLTLRADDNLLPYLTSQVRNGTLILDSRGSYRSRTTPQAVITVPNLDYVKISGSGNAVMAGVNNRSLDLLVQGSGDIRATGHTGHVKANIQGSGNADLRGLAAGRADVSVMGSGNAWVDTNGAVTAKSFGSGNVYVLGRPSSLDTQRAGSGRVVVRSR